MQAGPTLFVYFNVSYFMVKDLSLQLLDVVCGDGSVLNDTVCLLYQPL